MHLPALKGSLRLSHGRAKKAAIGDYLEVALHVLAVASGYRPRVFIPGWSVDRKTKRAPLRDRILRVAGVNPEDPSTFLPNNTGRIPSLNGSDSSLYKILEWGIHNVQAGIKGAEWGGIALTVRGENGSWALTEAGVALATSVHHHYRPGAPNEQGEWVPFPGVDDGIHSARNVTCCWLDAQIREHGLRDRLIETLSSTHQIRKEIETRAVDDHVDHWFELAIRRDGLRTRLATFDPPPFRQIKEWCLRSLWTTLRSRAQDADGRATSGAMTERERVSGTGPAKDAMAASSFTRIITRSEDTDEVSEDLVDTDALSRTQHDRDFAIGMKHVEQAFQELRPGNADRLSRIFGMMARGEQVHEMAEAEGVSRNRMASLCGAVRNALRDAKQSSDDMYLVLDYLRENPWSTRDDLAEDDDLKVVSDLDGTLAALDEKGRIVSRVFKTGVGYAVEPDEAARFLASRHDPRIDSRRRESDAIASLLL